MEKCLDCGQEFALATSLNRHIGKIHGEFQDYVLKWKHNGIRPQCACGCSQETSWRVVDKNFAKYRSGHAPNPHTAASKAAIGRKNSIKLKQYYENNPEKKQEKSRQLRSGITEDVEERRIENVKKFYSTPSQKLTNFSKKQSKHTKNLWVRADGLMQNARNKATETWHERYKNNEYDFTERDNKISKTVTEIYLSGAQVWSKGEYVSTKTGKTCRYRSSWELEYMIYFDTASDILDWIFEPCVIPYIKPNGKKGRYIPDFKIVTKQDTRLLEIKPSADGLMNNPLNLAKFAAATEYAAQNDMFFEIKGKLQNV